MSVMGEIIIQNIPTTGVTTIPNWFLEQYMPAANGEFVKVYLLLLHTISQGKSFSLVDMADALSCTERDIMRALQYWEKAGLLKLSVNDQKVTKLVFCQSPGCFPADTAQSVESNNIPAVPKEQAEGSRPEEAPKYKILSADRKQALQEQEEVRQFLYIAEQYLGRTLTRTDIDHLLYYYAELHFSADLIEYLIEYCVSKGSRSARYIETVALAWAQEGISTVEEAKAATSLRNKNYFSILKALGIQGRNPVEAEQKYMDRWLQELGFSMELIKEACQRTIMQTGQSSFQYADSILQDWHQHNVHDPKDLAALDEEHKKISHLSPNRSSSKNATGASGSDYPHRDYDFDEIKKSLFHQ